MRQPKRVPVPCPVCGQERLLTTSDAKRALAWLALPVEREVLVLDEGRHYLVDFVIGGTLAIEVNGGCHVLHTGRDLLKANAVRRAGYRLLILTESDMSDLERLLRSFVEGVYSVQLRAVA